MYGFMLYCICSVTHHRVRLWYLIRGIDGLFPFKCGLASKAGLRHLSWNNSGSSATGVERGGASYGARGRTWLLSASLYQVAQ
jgi:hypothetical protein